MDSFMIGLDVRPSGRVRASILEPAYDMTLETFTFNATRAPQVLDHRLDSWLELQPVDFAIAISLDDPWPEGVVAQMVAPYRVTQYRSCRVDDICRQASEILGAPLRSYRAQLLAFLLKYDTGRATTASVARKWALRMAKEFLCVAACNAHRHHRRRRLFQAFEKGALYGSHPCP